jgi:hydroxymethylpyrimidine/phosphomethylpyrimidine kinase
MVFSALTIAGSDSGGGAGIQGDLKTFMALRVHGLSIITSLTAQNTREVLEVFNVPVDFIKSQFEAIHNDFQVGAAKTGMLSEEKIIKVVASKIGSYPLVVDPVMIAESGGRLLAEDALNALKEDLLPKASIATPNIFEAEILSDMKIRNVDDMKAAAKNISILGCDVVIKGGHLDATDVLYIGGKFHFQRGRKLRGRFHGSGCAYSAAITASLAMGFDLLTSVFNAKEFIKGSLPHSYAPGKGDIKAVNQTRLAFEERFDEVLLSLRTAVCEIENIPGLNRFAAEVGINICFAKKGAGSIDDVAGVSGRIFRLDEDLRALGRVRYGASRHMARVVLSAMGFDADFRSAMNIKYSPTLIDRAEEAGDLDVSFFERDDEPSGASTMDWGTQNAIERAGKVPDLIYDRGGVGKEAMIRILGRHPEEVVAKLRKVIGADNVS